MPLFVIRDDPLAKMYPIEKCPTANVSIPPIFACACSGKPLTCQNMRLAVYVCIWNQKNMRERAQRENGNKTNQQPQSKEKSVRKSTPDLARAQVSL